MVLMPKREYKTIRLELKVGFVERDDPDFDATLNEYGAQGWRLVQVLQPAKPLGETSRYVLVFERET
jgi:hypothetical protein